VRRVARFAENNRVCQAESIADIRKAVETLESVARVWRRVFGEAHPETPLIRAALKDAREVLAARAA